MIIDDALFAQQFNKISANKQNPVYYNYGLNFLDENNDIIPTVNVLTVNRFSRFDSALADEFFITVDMYKSKYIELLKLDRRYLLGQVIRTLVSPLGTKLDASVTYIDTYNAYLLNPTSESIETRSGTLTGTHIDDLGELVEVNIHLVERGLSEYRLWEIAGVYRNITMQDLLKGLMSQPLKTLEGIGSGNYKVTIVPPDNNEKQFQVKIPNGIRLIDLPGWLQQTKGLYKTGIAYYLYMGCWYVFPPYDLSLYDKSIKRMTIINVPRNEMLGLTNSYALEDEELYIYTTGDTKHIDVVDKTLDESGTGFRMAKTGNVLNHFTESSKGKTIIPPGRNYVNISFDNHEELPENIKSPNGVLFSSNPWLDSSKITAGMGNVIIVNWENSNPYLIYPGMPIKFIYKYNGVPYSLYGVLLRVETEVKTLLKSVTDIRYVSHSVLAIFCERASR